MTIVLHHYPASLFSEKIRLLLGYYKLPWRSVIISNVMPRPLLMPLSGGYRKTPVLQIDANVYCDTRVIARALARHTADWSLYQAGFSAARLADWADTELFALTVAMNFRPEAMGAAMSQLSQADIAAFQADRAKLADGRPIVSMSPAVAADKLVEILTDLEHSLRANDFLFGDQLTIADFALYHCLWFLKNNAVNATLLQPHLQITDWMTRMAAFGHGEPLDWDAQQALDLAREQEPLLPDIGPSVPFESINIGDRVSVTPADYGRIPVTGELLAASAHEVVIGRDDPQAGRIMNHFPRAGFVVARADG